MPRMTPPWPPKTALITGAGGSLGRELCQRLAGLHCRQILADVNPVELQQSLRLAQDLGGDAVSFQLDVTQESSWSDLVREARQFTEHLDLVIHAAGVVAAGDYGAEPFHVSRRVLDVNLTGTMLGCHALLPWLKANPQGATIVNIASCAAFLPFPWMAAYNASKAGVVAFSRTLAAELWHTGIRVTTVCPGFFASGLLDRGEIPNPQVRKVAERIFQQTSLTIEQVAEATLVAAKKGPLMAVCPRPVRIMEFLARYFPGCLFWRIRREAWARRRKPESSA